MIHIEKNRGAGESTLFFSFSNTDVGVLLMLRLSICAKCSEGFTTVTINLLQSAVFTTSFQNHHVTVYEDFNDDDGVVEISAKNNRH